MEIAQHGNERSKSCASILDGMARFSFPISFV
jgi:hypothetical protein